MSNLAQRNNLESSKTAFLLCDIQERFQSSIYKFNELVEIANRLVTASKILDIPLVVTEQYPKGLGQTVSSLDISQALIKVEKTKFSMYCNEIKDLLEKKNIDTIVLFGVETHVCVLQTAIDFLNQGFNVHVVADACSSRSLTDRMLAIERLRQAGCIVTTHESVLFQLIKDKNHEKFKEIQKLIITMAPDTGLFHKQSSF